MAGGGGNEDDRTAPELKAASGAVDSVVPKGAVRRIGLELVKARLRGGPPPTLGRFRIVRKLGEGGMGAVFEAVDPRLERTVALKVLRDPAFGGPSIDIEHEARMLARLSHPNVVTVYELGEADGEKYVCMEYVQGTNLARYLEDHPEAPLRTVGAHLLAAARGLAAAHRAGIVHRDVKPENVLVGDDGLVRVTDFGLASAQGAPVDVASLASLEPEARSVWVGTPGYVAPEVLRGEPATPKSDQYGFFVTVRETLRRARATVPAIHALVTRGTATSPDARFTDMDEVVTALAATLERREPRDARAREVLSLRVQKLWIDPVRARALSSSGRELPVRADRLDGLVEGGTEVPLGRGSAAEIAAALHAFAAGVLLVGAPGAGKTIRLLGIAEALLERAREQDEVPLPVVLNLSSFGSFEGGMRDWLVHELVAKYALSRRNAEQWLDDGSLSVLFDGLDELEVGERPRCVEALNALRRERPMPFVVVCREENYRALPARLHADVAIGLRPLDEETVVSMLNGLDVSPRVVALVKRDPALAEALRSPLLLALFSQLAGDLDADALEPDALRERLYSLTLERALDRAPALDPGKRRRIESGLRWLASAMSRASVTELWLEEMQASWLPTRAQRTFAIALGVSAAFAISIGINLAASVVAQQPWYSGLFFGVVAAAAALVIQGGFRIVPMEAMRWSWARVRRFIPVNLALGVAMGAAHGYFFDFWADLLLGIATGVFGLSVIGLVPEGRERRVDPGDGLVESLRNGLLVSPVIGFVIGAPVGYLVLPLARPLAAPTSMYHVHPNPELSWAVTLGTSAAVTSLFITGVLAPLMHAALRLTIAWTSPLPLGLVAWLDELADRDLMNRVGGGFLFRHPTLRAWLARADERAAVSPGGEASP